MAKPLSFASKFVLCVMLSFLFASTILLLGTDMSAWISPPFIFLLAALLFILPFILLPVWEYRERKHLPGVNLFFERGQNLIACLTACCIAIFGWKKIFLLQFRTPLSIADLPMSSQSGETLTWYYFGHSPVLATIIALIQISGGALLLSKKTRLIAVLLLLPVMLNILLINIFYQMNAGALLQSAVLTFSLFYLLLRYRSRLFSLLLPSHDSFIASKQRGKWAIIIVCLIFPLIFIFMDSRSVAKESSLYGRYEVMGFSVNEKQIRPNIGGACDSVLTRVYFDMNNVCVLEYNSPGRRLMAKYKFDETNKTLESTMENAGIKHLLKLLVNIKKNQEIEMKGKFGGDTIQLLLAKTN